MDDEVLKRYMPSERTTKCGREFTWAVFETMQPVQAEKYYQDVLRDKSDEDLKVPNARPINISPKYVDDLLKYHITRK